MKEIFYIDENGKVTTKEKAVTARVLEIDDKGVRKELFLTIKK